MTKLNLPSTDVDTALENKALASSQTLEEAAQEAKLAAFMRKAAEAAVDLSPMLTAEIEKRGLQIEQAIVAVLLFVANMAGKLGARREDFLASADQAFGDAAELFASPVVDILKKTRELIAKGFCQGNMAKKWRKDVTAKEGKVLVDCGWSDKYASKFSVVGALSLASDAPSNLTKGLECLMLAIVQSGYPVKPGSLVAIIVQEWSDYGFNPVDGTTTPDARTKEQALAMIDAAIAIAARS